jgi:DNA-directed RNA polymerase specialized sigma24 family protein
VVLACWLAIPKYDTERQALPYFYQVSKNAILKLQRSCNSKRKNPPLPVLRTEDLDFEDREPSSCARIEQLRFEAQRAEHMRMAYMAGWTISALARRYSMTPSTVKRILRR